MQAMVLASPGGLLVALHSGGSPEQRALAVCKQTARTLGGRLLTASDPVDLRGLLDVMLGDEEVSTALVALSFALPHLSQGALLASVGTVVSGATPRKQLEQAQLLAAHLQALESRPDANQEVLKLSVADAYRNDAPPPEVMELVLGYAQVPLALLALIEASSQGAPLPDWLAEALCEVILRGYEARLRLMASAGLPVPDDLIPSAQRLDLPALFAQSAEVYRQWGEALARFAGAEA